MNDMTQVPLDHPLMLAWVYYMNTDDFKNSLMWAAVTKYSQAGRIVPNDEINSVQREEHAKGSLWAAFTAGFTAGFNAASERTEKKAHRVMTPEEYQTLNIQGWHMVCKNADGSIGLQYYTPDTEEDAAEMMDNGRSTGGD